MLSHVTNSRTIKVATLIFVATVLHSIFAAPVVLAGEGDYHHAPCLDTECPVRVRSASRGGAHDSDTCWYVGTKCGSWTKGTVGYFCLDHDDKYCGCDASQDWSTLGWHSDKHPCTVGDPGTGDDGSEPGLPQTLSCDQICEGEDPACETCCGDGGTWTEVGCITATQSGIIAAVMRIFIGIVTAIAVLRFIQAGIMFNTEDPDKIKEAKSIATSAVVALILAGTLPVILNFVLDVDVLGIGKIFG
jgi:hypothetical protein